MLAVEEERKGPSGDPGSSKLRQTGPRTEVNMGSLRTDKSI